MAQINNICGKGKSFAIVAVTLGAIGVIWGVEFIFLTV